MKKRGVAAVFAVAVILIAVLAIAFLFFGRINEKQFSIEEKALDNSEKVLNKFLKDFLHEEFLPEVLDVKYRLAWSGGLNATNYTFGAIWDISAARFNANVHYDYSLSAIQDYSVRVLIDFPPDGLAYTSPEFAKLYFKRFPGNGWECRMNNDYNLTICESFSVSKDYSEGVAVIISPDSPPVGAVACHLNKVSQYYSSESCVPV